MGVGETGPGRRRARPKPPTRQPRRYPSRSHINDPDLKTLADFSHHYPLPEGFDYRERKKGDVVVVCHSDGKEFVFLVEEGILAWDEPEARQDGSLRYKTTEVFKRRGGGSEAGPRPDASAGGVEFPLGRNSIADVDIRTFEDLHRYYPLPAGFEYQRTVEGYPVVVRLVDGAQFAFLIEEGLLTFNEPYTRDDGKTGFRTTEVFRHA